MALSHLSRLLYSTFPPLTKQYLQELKDCHKQIPAAWTLESLAASVGAVPIWIPGEGHMKMLFSLQT